ncbi:MAG: hypothetical protein ACYS47_16015, partial [Planctomycetota bacterium]
MSDEAAIAEGDPLVLAAREASWKKVETLWLERLEGEAPPPAAFLEAGRLLCEARERDLLKVLTSMTAPVLLGLDESEAVLALARIAARGRVDDADLVEATLAAARIIHREHSAVDGLVTRADLERGRGLSHVLTLLDAFFLLDVGGLARHTGGWGVGEVKKIVVRREEIHIRFESGRSHVFPMRTAGEYLIPLPADSLDARVRRDPEGLKAEARRAPLELIGRALDRGGGGVDGRELKDLLVPAVLREGEWGGWWNGTRDKIRKNPHLDITSGANPRVTRRKKPKTVEAEAGDRLAQAGSFADKLKVLRGYGKKTTRREADAAFIGEAFGALAALQSEPADAASLHFLGEELKCIDPALHVPPFPEVTGFSGLRAHLERLELAEYKARFLEEMRARFPQEWPEAFASLLFIDDPDILEPAVTALLEEGHAARVEAKIPGLMAAPGKRPWAFLWFYRLVFHGRFCLVLERLPSATDLLDRLLDVHHGAVTFRIAEGGTAKKIFLKARTGFTNEALRKAFTGVTEAVAKRL